MDVWCVGSEIERSEKEAQNPNTQVPRTSTTATHTIMIMGKFMEQLSSTLGFFLYFFFK
jgi:hypothetical protein